MPIAVSVRMTRQFVVKANAETVFDLLADVPRSGSHYPQIASIENVATDAFRWEFEPLGVAGLEHVVVYACAYESDAAAGLVSWKPHDDIGNAQVNGAWTVHGTSSGTQIDFRVEVELSVPAPRFLSAVVTPFVQATFERQLDEYIANLTRTLGGKAG